MKKVLKITANIILWLIVIIALIITIVVFSSSSGNGVAHLLGYIPLTVESQSMSPTFEEGDLIICKQIDDASTLKENDVITFWTIIEGRKVKNTHRIVKINNTGNSLSFITRGDNNPIDDEIPAYQADLIGKWTNIRLSGAGNIMAFLRTKLGFFLCILLPMALFFLFELYKFIVTVISVRKPEAAPALDEEEIKRRAIEEYLAAQKEKEQAEKSGSDDKKETDKKSEDEKKSESDDKDDKKESDKKSEDEKKSESDDKDDKKESDKKSEDEKKSESDDKNDKKDSEAKSDEKTKADTADDKK